MIYCGLFVNKNSAIMDLGNALKLFHKSPFFMQK